LIVPVDFNSNTNTKATPFSHHLFSPDSFLNYTQSTRRTSSPINLSHKSVREQEEEEEEDEDNNNINTNNNNDDDDDDEHEADEDNDPIDTEDDISDDDSCNR
jgi:hypothetical protein